MRKSNHYYSQTHAPLLSIPKSTQNYLLRHPEIQSQQLHLNYPIYREPLMDGNSIYRIMAIAYLQQYVFKYRSIPQIFINPPEDVKLNQELPKIQIRGLEKVYKDGMSVVELGSMIIKRLEQKLDKYLVGVMRMVAFSGYRSMVSKGYGWIEQQGILRYGQQGHIQIMFLIGNQLNLQINLFQQQNGVIVSNRFNPSQGSHHQRLTINILYPFLLYSKFQIPNDFSVFIKSLSFHQESHLNQDTLFELFEKGLIHGHQVWVSRQFKEIEQKEQKKKIVQINFPSNVNLQVGNEQPQKDYIQKALRSQKKRRSNYKPYQPINEGIFASTSYTVDYPQVHPLEFNESASKAQVNRSASSKGKYAFQIQENNMVPDTRQISGRFKSFNSSKKIKENQQPFFQQSVQNTKPFYDTPKNQSHYETPNFDPPKFDPPKYQPPKYQPPKYQPPKYQPPKYKAPKYQAPIYQPPVYQQPQYQQPQYPQYKVPVFEPPKFQPPVFKAPKYQAPKYQAPKYKAPKYQAPKYQAPQYEEPEYETPYYEQPKYENPKMQMRYSRPQVQQRQSSQIQPIYQRPQYNTRFIPKTNYDPNYQRSYYQQTPPSYQPIIQPLQYQHYPSKQYHPQNQYYKNPQNIPFQNQTTFISPPENLYQTSVSNKSPFRNQHRYQRSPLNIRQTPRNQHPLQIRQIPRYQQPPLQIVQTRYQHPAYKIRQTARLQHSPLRIRQNQRYQHSPLQIRQTPRYQHPLQIRQTQRHQFPHLQIRQTPRYQHPLQIQRSPRNCHVLMDNVLRSPRYVNRNKDYRLFRPQFINRQTCCFQRIPKNNRSLINENSLEMSQNINSVCQQTQLSNRRFNPCPIFPIQTPYNSLYPMTKSHSLSPFQKTTPTNLYPLQRLTKINRPRAVTPPPNIISEAIQNMSSNSQICPRSRRCVGRYREKIKSLPHFSNVGLQGIEKQRGYQFDLLEGCGILSRRVVQCSCKVRCV